jgi:hypothetical protein
MLRNLCGTAALPNVMLVTTMWDITNEQICSLWERDFREVLWYPMFSVKARMVRHYNNRDSAWDIVDQLIGMRYPLEMQVEMVERKKDLMQTAAFSALRSVPSVVKLNPRPVHLSSFRGSRTNRHLGSLIRTFTTTPHDPQNDSNTSLLTTSTPSLSTNSTRMASIFRQRATPSESSFDINFESRSLAGLASFPTGPPRRALP